MVREVKVLWVKERSLLDAPLIVAPKLGEIRIRGAIYAGVAIVTAYVASLGLGLGLMAAPIAVVAAMTALALESKARETAVPPEKQLLYLVTGNYKPRAAPRLREVKKAREEVVEVRLSEPAKPVTVVGIVRDKATGAPLAEAELEILVDGEVVGKTVSDEHGRYTCYVMLKPGAHVVEVRYAGSTIDRKRVVVTVEKE